MVGKTAREQEAWSELNRVVEVPGRRRGTSGGSWLSGAADWLRLGQLGRIESLCAGCRHGSFPTLEDAHLTSAIL